MANGAEEVTAAGTKLEAGLKDSDGGEHPKITNNQHEEHIQTEPERNGVEVHWGFPLSHLYRIGLKFYKGKIIFLLFFLILPFSSYYTFSSSSSFKSSSSSSSSSSSFIPSECGRSYIYFHSNSNLIFCSNVQ